jgi:DNA invertase Pin-like site-specific DNA recombinase
VIALGYARRSKASADDARDGRRVVSLETQAAKIRDYADAQGWTLADILTDDGVSGGRRERLERLAARVQATKARAVVVYTLDRYARDVAGLLDSLRTFQRRGVSLHTTDRGRVDTGTAAASS